MEGDDLMSQSGMAENGPVDQVLEDEEELGGAFDSGEEETGHEEENGERGSDERKASVRGIDAEGTTSGGESEESGGGKRGKKGGRGKGRGGGGGGVGISVRRSREGSVTRKDSVKTSASGRSSGVVEITGRRSGGSVASGKSSPTGRGSTGRASVSGRDSSGVVVGADRGSTTGGRSSGTGGVARKTSSRGARASAETGTAERNSIVSGRPSSGSAGVVEGTSIGGGRASVGSGGVERSSLGSASSNSPRGQRSSRDSPVLKKEGSSAGSEDAGSRNVKRGSQEGTLEDSSGVGRSEDGKQREEDEQGANFIDDERTGLTPVSPGGEYDDRDEHLVVNEGQSPIGGEELFYTGSAHSTPSQTNAANSLVQPAPSSSRYTGPLQTQQENSRSSKEARFSIGEENYIQFSMLPPVLNGRKTFTYLKHQFGYKQRARYIRDVLGGVRAPCKNQNLTYRYAGPATKQSRYTRRWIRDDSMEPRDVNWVHPNPPVSVPMRARPWKKMTWLPAPPPDHEQWKVEAQEEKLRKGCEKANQLGYETLLGNLVYQDIPGAKDLNRSWKHFLDRNPMSWGFPYTKGSTERPSLPLPVPYLVHQLKESLWKYPKNKFLHSTND